LAVRHPKMHPQSSQPASRLDAWQGQHRAYSRTMSRRHRSIRLTALAHSGLVEYY
jgi:hypothetical protein